METKEYKGEQQIIKIKKEINQKVSWNQNGNITCPTLNDAEKAVLEW